MLHNYLKKSLFIVFCLFLFSCGSSDEGGPSSVNSGVSTVPEQLRGQWFEVQNATGIYLGPTTPYTLEKIEENLIKLEDKSRNITMFATRFGSSKSSVAMVVSKPDDGSTKGYSAIGGLEVILQNLNDKNNRHVAHTDNEGKVTVNGLISSDYSVTIEGNETYRPTQLEYSVNGHTDLAIVTPCEKGSYSFKTSYQSDQEFIYGDYASYSGYINIKNIGEADAESASYSFSVDNGSHILLTDDNDTNLKDIIKTIEAGTMKTVRVKFKTRFLSDTGADGDVYVDRINIVVTDKYGKKWHDYVPINIHRRSVTLSMDGDLRHPNYSSCDLNGIVIFPGRYLKRIYGLKEIKIPLFSSEPYKLLISNINANTEQTYSIGVDVPCHARADIDLFEETGKDERGVNGNTTGNDTEQTAIQVKSGEKYMAYIGKNDIDYYLLNMSEAAKEPVVLTCDKSSAYLSVFDTTSGQLIRGNSDEKINPGENVVLNLAITNTGTSTAYGVKTCIALTPETQADGFVSIASGMTCSDSNQYPIGDIGGKTTKDCNGYVAGTYYFLKYYTPYSINFLLQISEAAPVGYEIELVATITDANNHLWTCPVILPVYPNQ